MPLQILVRIEVYSGIARFLCNSTHFLVLSADCSEFSVNQVAHVRVNVSGDLKLLGREVIFEVFQPM